MRLTSKEVRRVKKGAEALEKSMPMVVNGEGANIPVYACEVLGFGHLADKMRSFYLPTYIDDDYDKWDGLIYKLDEMTEESQLQRILMLELFAHLKGKL